MLRKTLLWIGSFIAVFFVIGCVTTTTTGKNKAQVAEAKAPEKKGIEIHPPALTIGDIAKQPAHVKFVIAAIVNKMRGNRDSGPEVTFDPKGKHAFYDKDFTYDDFKLLAIQLTGFQVKKQTKKEAEIVIEGVFNFGDLFGRRVADYFAADYTVKKGGITINKSATALIAPTLPEIQTFIVPKSSFKGTNLKELSSFMDLYVHALLNAFNMVPTQEDRINKQKYEKLSVWKKSFSSVNSTPEDSFIMVFCKDRLPSYASLELKITDNPDMEGQSILDTLYINDHGWRVLVSGGKFSVNALKDNFYVNVLYNTNSGPDRKTVRIASYMNRKRYEDNQKFVVIRKQRKVTAQKEVKKLTETKPQSGPIESGKVFLDPRKKRDAKIIQSRLKELGYYKKRIDGIFGPGSRKALKNFKQDNNLADNSVWDLNTQKILFKNTGK